MKASNLSQVVAVQRRDPESQPSMFRLMQVRLRYPRKECEYTCFILKACSAIFTCQIGVCRRPDRKERGRMTAFLMRWIDTSNRSLGGRQPMKSESIQQRSFHPRASNSQLGLCCIRLEEGTQGVDCSHTATVCKTKSLLPSWTTRETEGSTVHDF